jgi:hypothetical protein
MDPMTTVRDELGERISAVTEAETALQALGGLLEGLHLFAPRAAIFLVRRGEACGWNSVGYSTATTASLREMRSPLGQGWLGQLAESAEAGPHTCPAQADPAPAPGEALGLTIRVSGTPLAVLLVERSAAEEPWNPAAVALLATLVRLRLELILAARKIESMAAGPTKAAPAAEPSENKAEARTEQPSPVEQHAAKDEGESAEVVAAGRFARLVATDIRLYNEEAVLLGRRHRDLAKRLADPIKRGRESFTERHAGLGAPGLQLLRDAFVEVLGGGDETLLPASCFE